MRLQHKEQEATDIYRSLAREPDTQGYVPVEQESTVLKGEFATNTHQRSTCCNMGEAFCVTTCLLVLEVLWHFMTRNLTSVVATSLIPSPVYLEDTLKFIYFLLAALVAVIMGVGVGFLANRRTIVTSLIIANVCIAIGVQVLSLHYIYTNLPEAVFAGLGWKYAVAFVIPNLFRSLTVAVTEVAVALYVARKFRKNL